ncbi:MAG: hypothetical protein EOM34_09635 [Clostridia bacterium]|nr:hypothetical protein [Lachnospiraceae bacterium]NCC00925.1 hypothetical protein [Clostridia bacterium]NCD02415.1 hypothetical protein [Clostridia bacterium]
MKKAKEYQEIMEEKELIRKYRELSDIDKGRILEKLEIMHSKMQSKPQNGEIIKFNNPNK